MLISKTPFRLSLYGGGLDYPEWYQKREARILCAGLDYYCYQTVRVLPPFFEHKYRASYSEIETAKEIKDIKHPSVREVLNKYSLGKNIEVTHIGDLPSRSGIGSSSAFTVGLINSLTALDGKYMGRTELAKAAIELEQGAMNEKVGVQDQCAAAFGGIILIEADAHDIKPRRFVAAKEYVDYICENMLMGFNGQGRLSQEAAKEITHNISSTKNEEMLRELEAVSNEGINIFGLQNDINEHAKLTKEAREIKRRLNGDEKNERLSELIEATEAAGSLCTRTMGAGGGGFFICWAPKYRHEAIRRSVKISTWVDVKISQMGSQIVYYDQ